MADKYNSMVKGASLGLSALSWQVCLHYQPYLGYVMCLASELFDRMVNRACLILDNNQNITSNDATLRPRSGLICAMKLI